MYVGFDIGGTTIKYGLVDAKGNVSKKGAIPTHHNKEVLINDLVEIVENFRQDETILGVGISAPGIIKNGFMLTAGSIKPLYGTHLKEEMEKKIQLPVSVENDGNAAAIAERWLGNAQDCDNYLCIVLGTGIGAGIVINGKIYAGQHGMAGEFGWMLIDQLPKVGNLEEVSLNQRGSVIMGLCRLYNAALKEIDPTAEDIFDAQVILAKKDQGDVLAQKIFEQYLDDLSVMLINLVGTFDPEKILIGGGISANEEFMGELKERFLKNIKRHESLNYLKEIAVAEICAAKLKNNAGIIGAVYQLITV